ncbi:ABC transporter substrate-binding protein [Halomarina halobia]|uniref:ABC transporter substrate-binding protein n=1 Tax=Halomarina halobia TaxID=3033386 RepID=A0ABD6AEX2_9EURY|nr:ABC transporter substrate-binding protein [Halomarina sp. PSR21]
MRPPLKPDGDIVQRGIPPVDPHLDRRTFLKGAGAATIAASMAGCSNPAADGGGGGGGGGGEIPSEPLRMACVGFTSGPAAVFGTPMMQAARMIVDKINDNGGILGERTIEMEEYDENNENISQQYRQLATQENYDIIIGYISSANALTVGPIAEELGQPTIIWDTGTTELFDNAITDPKYVFRTCASSSTDAVGAALVLKNALPDVETVAGVNQDYAYGRNNWNLFRKAIDAFSIDVEVVESRFTPFPNEDFSSTISALNDSNPDYLFSSLWGGDLVNFMTQANGRGLFDDTLPCFSGGTHVFADAPKQVPDGLLFGARGPHFPYGVLGWNSLHEEFVTSFEERYDASPYAHGAFHAWQALHGYVHAVERAYNLSGEYPGPEAWIQSMEGIGFDTASGFLSIPRGSHNAVEPSFWGFSDTSSENISLRDPVWIAKEEVNPPVNKTTGEWLDSI